MREGEGRYVVDRKALASLLFTYPAVARLERGPALLDRVGTPLGGVVRVVCGCNPLCFAVIFGVGGRVWLMVDVDVDVFLRGRFLVRWV